MKRDMMHCQLWRFMCLLAPVVTTQINYLVDTNEALEGFLGMAQTKEYMMLCGSSSISATKLASLMTVSAEYCGHGYSVRH